MTILERFLNKIEPQENGCWLWTGSLDKGGYGRFKFRGSNWKAARVSYTLWVSEIPEGFQIDHVKARGCTNKSCVCPDHLEAVTQQVNLNRGNINQNKNKTHCNNGHMFTKENTRLYSVKGQLKRKCRICEGRYPSQVGERRATYNRTYKAKHRGGGSN